jgi:hypothetical protein
MLYQGSTLLTFAIHKLTKQGPGLPIIGYDQPADSVDVFSLANGFPASLIEINQPSWKISAGYSPSYIFSSFLTAFLNTRDVGEFVEDICCPHTDADCADHVHFYLLLAVRKGVQT